MKSNQIILVLLLLVIVGGGGFYGGMKYQQGQGNSYAQQGFGGGNFSNGARVNGSQRTMMQGRNGGFRPVNGSIISVGDNSITVQLTDGSSRIVLLSDKTTISKAENAVKSDLQPGVKVAVFGTANTDGSVSAQNIQLNPQTRMFDRSPSPTGTK